MSGQHKFSDPQESELERRYIAGEGTVLLAREYRTYSGTVTRILKRRGVVLRPNGTPRTKILRDGLGGILEAAANESVRSIAKRCGVATSTISRLLLKHGVREIAAARPRPRKANVRLVEHNPLVVGSGYVVVWVDSDHPFASMRQTNKRTTGGYVFQHRLVMAEAIGRPLTDQETVHHIDGNHANNSRANLQLRSGQHGNGVVLRCNVCGSPDINAIPIASL